MKEGKIDQCNKKGLSSVKSFTKLSLGLIMGLIGLHNGAALSQAPTDSIAEIMLLCQRYNGGWSKALNGKGIVYT